MAVNEIQVACPEAELKIRPYEHHAKYYETDQMGIIHHSNYVKCNRNQKKRFITFLDCQI